MPPHIIHLRWAKKLGLRVPYLSNYPPAVWDEPFTWDVDSMIDFPKRHIDQFKSLKSLGVWNRGLKDKMEQNLNDLSRVDKEVMHAYLYLLEPKGKDYVKAFFLHHLLDVLGGQEIVEGRKSLMSEEDESGLFKGDFLKIVERHKLIKEYKEVESFVRRYRNEILRDIKSPVS